MLLDQAARRYATRPSAMLGVSSTRTALAFDLALAQKAALHDLEHQSGEFWWIPLAQLAKGFMNG